MRSKKGVYEYTYSINRVLNTFTIKSHLVNVELLGLKIAQLTVVHLSPFEDMHSFLLQCLFSHALGCQHLLLDGHEFLVALVDFGLNNFASFVELMKEVII